MDIKTQIYNNNINTLKVAGKSFFTNRFDNLLTMADGKPLESLRGVHYLKTAIIVASGPSLSKNIKYLRTVQNRALIIATDSAVVPLMDNGIVPDYIATVDFRDSTYEKLVSVQHELSNTSLIMLSSVSSKIPSIIKFKEIYYAEQNTQTNKMLDHLLGDDTIPLPNMSSCLHLALCTAQIAGCNTIIFTGLDLGYSGRHDHVQGTVLNWGNNIKENDNSVYVEGIDGKPVHTNAGFIDIRDICTNIMQAVPGIRYIDATEGGALVRGTEIDKLKNVLKGLDEDNTIKEVTHLFPKKRRTDILNRLYVFNDRLWSLDKLLNNYGVYSEKVLNYLHYHRGFDLRILPLPIERCVQQMDIINDILNKDEIIGYMKELMAEYNTQYVEHNETDSIMVNNLKQQVFVQSIRKKALDVFMGIIHEQVILFYSVQ